MSTLNTHFVLPFPINSVPLHSGFLVKHIFFVFTASCDNSRCFFVCAQEIPTLTGRDNKKSNLLSKLKS